MTDTATRPLPSFAALRRIAQTSGIAHACIELRAQQVAWAGWDIVPVPEAAGAMRANRKALQAFGRRRIHAMRFFRHCDANYGAFPHWAHAVAGEVLETDSLSLHVRRPRETGGGVLGSDLAALELIDGATIAPLCDDAGALVQCAQFAADVRRLSSAGFHVAVRRPGVISDGAELGRYGRRELLYRPFAHRTWTPFGFSPLEQAIAYGKAGEIDVAATEAKIPEAFGFEFTAPDDFKDKKHLDRTLRTWLKGIFDEVLHEHLGAPDLEWKWEEAS